MVHLCFVVPCGKVPLFVEDRALVVVQEVLVDVALDGALIFRRV